MRRPVDFFAQSPGTAILRRVAPKQQKKSLKNRLGAKINAA